MATDSRRTRGGSTVIDEDGVSGQITGSEAVDFAPLKKSRSSRAMPPSTLVVDRDTEFRQSKVRTADMSDDDDFTVDAIGDNLNPEEDADDDREDELPEEDEDTDNRPVVPNDQVDYRDQLAALQEQYEAAQNDLQSWNDLLSQAGRDPKGAVEAMAAALNVSLGELGQQPVSFDYKNYTPENDFEAALLQHYETLTGVPQQIGQFTQWAQQYASFADNLYLENALLKERLSALEESLGYDTEEGDTSVLAAALQKEMAKNPNLDIRKYLKESYGKTVREKHLTKKQAQKKRPETLSNGAGAGGREKTKGWLEAIRAVNKEQGW